MNIPQWLETNGRIFVPVGVRRAGWTPLGFQVVMIGGHTWNIPASEEADGMWASLKLSGMFIEHERWLHNPNDVVMITINTLVCDKEYKMKEVRLFYANSDVLTVRDDAAGLYEKWQAHKLNCDRVLAIHAAQQQAMMNQSLVNDTTKLTEDFSKKLRRN